MAYDVPPLSYDYGALEPHIDELFKLKDRKGADLVLAMTHEEIVTTHVAQVVRSYRDLPLILYHLSVKERDEPRPRAGVLRTREFTMKDSYSFDRDEAGLLESYDKHIGAYDRIFDRSGLEWYRVESVVGMMGGQGAMYSWAPSPPIIPTSDSTRYHSRPARSKIRS